VEPRSIARTRIRRIAEPSLSNRLSRPVIEREIWTTAPAPPTRRSPSASPTISPGRLGTGGEVEHRVLEALALDEFRQGHLSRAELRQLLGFATRGKLDEFLTAHGVFGTYTPQDLERDRRDLQRLGF
jgi:hypothetical protein